MILQIGEIWNQLKNEDLWAVAYSIFSIPIPTLLRRPELRSSPDVINRDRCRSQCSNPHLILSMTDRRQKSSWGFTLIELLLVVILLGIIAGLAIPQFSHSYTNLQLKETTQNIAYLMRYAQGRAVMQKRLCQLSFDESRRRYWLTELSEDPSSQGEEKVLSRIRGRLGRTFDIPDNITLESDVKCVSFFPDGTVDETKIFLSNEKDVTFTIVTRAKMGKIVILDERYE